MAFVLSQRAGQKLETAVNRNGGTAYDIEWLSRGKNFAIVMRLASEKRRRYRIIYGSAIGTPGEIRAPRA